MTSPYIQIHTPGRERGSLPRCASGRCVWTPPVKKDQ